MTAPPEARFDCPLCSWHVDARITVCDPAPGCTIEETFERHQAQLATLMHAEARRRLAAHLREAHADWPDLTLPERSEVA